MTLRDPTVHDDDEIAARLVSLPLWTYADGALQRRFRTTNYKATLILVTAIGHCCEAAWHHPEMVVGFDTILVKLSTHRPKGITDRDFALAARLDALVDWRPDPSDPLTGPPAGHALLKA